VDFSRRDFLKQSLLLGVGGVILPSSIWPHRKIFSPSAVSTSPLQRAIDVGLEWDAQNGLWRIREEGIVALYEQILKDIKGRKQTWQSTKSN
jgi:hypothetical protein